MHQYQQTNDIKLVCCSNSLILREWAKNTLNIDIDIICGYVVCFDFNKGITEHCWCEYNGQLLEPSFNWFEHPRIYVKRFKELVPFVNSCDLNTIKEFIAYRAKFETQVKFFQNNGLYSDYAMTIKKILKS